MFNGFLKVAAAVPQIVLCDTNHNAREIIKLMNKAESEKVELIVFPELCVTGYSAGDLFKQKTLLDGALAALEKIKKETEKLSLIAVIGLPLEYKTSLFNCAAVLHKGKILGVVPKTHLPNYCEFYEARIFSSGDHLKEMILFQENVPCGTNLVFEERGGLFTFSAEICEDLWVAESPSVKLAEGGAKIICNLSASPEAVGKAALRKAALVGHSLKLASGYIYAGSGSGESTADTVFSGPRIIAENGKILAESPLFTLGLTVTEIDLQRIDFMRRQSTTFVYEGKDMVYVPFDAKEEKMKLNRVIEKLPFVPSQNGLERAEFILSLQAEGLKHRAIVANAGGLIVGVSGGLDSALALLVAKRAQALCGKKVAAVTMPCFGTGADSLKRAVDLCAALDVPLKKIDITESVRLHFKDIGHDEKDLNAVYENAQARERAQVLFDLANGDNSLVVGTGDMSELALGFTTYNGDHMSSYAVNAGVSKTLVKFLVAYEGARLGGQTEKVLSDTLNAHISPELLPPIDGQTNQKTEEILGKYELHDFFLYYFVRWGFTPKKIFFLAKEAFGEENADEIKRVMKVFFSRFFAQQFKRSCAPDSVKIGSVSLSPKSDFKMPSDVSAAIWLKETEDL